MEQVICKHWADRVWVVQEQGTCQTHQRTFPQVAQTASFLREKSLFTDFTRELWDLCQHSWGSEPLGFLIYTIPCASLAVSSWVQPQRMLKNLLGIPRLSCPSSTHQLNRCATVKGRERRCGQCGHTGKRNTDRDPVTPSIP